MTEDDGPVGARGIDLQHLEVELPHRRAIGPVLPLIMIAGRAPAAPEPMSAIAFDGMKPEAEREPRRVAAARERLDAMFAGLDAHLARRTWLMGEAFTMADCALIPSLGYFRMLHPFDRWKNLSAYAARAFERPSYAKVQAELAPYLEARASA